jgi:hypothetical protein
MGTPAVPAEENTQTLSPAHSFASTEPPDAQEHRDLMLSLRERDPPFCHTNAEGWVVIDLEYFSLSSNWSKAIGDTITVLHKTWDSREQLQRLSWREFETLLRKVGRNARERWEVLWPREIAWAFMTPDGHRVIWDVKECYMPLSLAELRKAPPCSEADLRSMYYLSKNIHYLQWESRDRQNTRMATEVVKQFVHFCREMGARKIFLKGNDHEAHRLRSWLRLADPSFTTPLFNSPDWRYVAPKWRKPATLRRYVEEVRYHYREHVHGWNKQNLSFNHHCAACECLYYATHYKFKSETQDWTPRPFPTYRNFNALTDAERSQIRGSGG